mgnify:CR=1 FL=1
MLTMTSSELPPLRSVRQNKMLHLIYGFPDESGKGKWSSLHDLRDSQGQKYRIGVWTAEESEETANWREFTTLVRTVEEEAEDGRLTDTRVIMFTDSITVERAWLNGTSSSSLLLDLVIHFKAVQLKFSFKVEVFHIAGTQMIACSRDGWNLSWLPKRGWL